MSTLAKTAQMATNVVFICRVTLDQQELNSYWRRVTGTFAGHPAQVLNDRGRFLILEGQGPVQGVTVYEFASKDAARSWYNSAAYGDVWQHRKKGAKCSQKAACRPSSNDGIVVGMAYDASTGETPAFIAVPRDVMKNSPQPARQPILPTAARNHAKLGAFQRSNAMLVFG
jgi:uncharacterized protein (DUF1330 family)